MKSFSIKVLALALVVVAGSVQAYPGKQKIEAIDRLLFGEEGIEYVHVHGDSTVQVTPSISGDFFDEILGSTNPEIQNSRKVVFIGGFPPFSTLHPHCRNGYIRAVITATTAAGIVIGVCKLYKHFTKPADDATVEDENVDITDPINKAELDATKDKTVITLI